VKVGDLVKLAMHKTRKGMPYDNTIGVVIKVEQMRLTTNLTIVKAVFDGMPYTFSIGDLEVISENR